MQLTKIKIAGFKSFVDPTTVFLPTNLIAVVGPNGCGKSNIIDAVCWVMGESRAKFLRGESLTDVIFNGSTARKPIGQASVELIFDNSDGTIGGEYSSFAEISIRRQITRDSESAYFLNGVRCRRKDVIDIFLGTGLGPRSYSIIGQNMIQRVVEAHPDDLRVYLEEAAGISKYKDRRRETETRIQHAKENLVRLNDIRTELDKQLTTLKRQANAAEKFTLLKEEERILRAQWLAIQWRHFDARLVGETLQIQQQSTGLEARQAELSDLNLQLEYKRDAERLANEQYQDVQRQYYTIGNDVTKVEQEIQHHQTIQKQWQSDYEQIEQDWLGVKEQLEESEQEIQDLSDELSELQPKTEEAISLVESAKKELAQSEESMQAWQATWDDFNQHVSKNTQAAQVSQTQIQHADQKMIALKARLLKLDQEKNQLDFTIIEKEIAEITQQRTDAEQKIVEQRDQTKTVEENIVTLQQTEQATSEQLNRTRNDLQILNGKQASLEALQQTASGQRNNSVVEWLKKNKLDEAPRLLQQVEVESGWENAVEKVLGAYVQAICVDDLSQVNSLIDQFKQGNLQVIGSSQSSDTTTVKPNSLLSKVKSEWPLNALLGNIYVAETDTDALQMCSALSSHESVITRDAVWRGATWLSVLRDKNPEAGVFQREQELKQLAKQIKEHQQSQKELDTALVDIRVQLKEASIMREDCQKNLNKSHSLLSEIKANDRMQQQRLLDLKKRAELFHKEHEDCSEQLNESQTTLQKARQVWTDAMTALESQTEQKDSLTASRDQLREQVQHYRNQMNQAKDHAHQFQIRFETAKSQQSHIQHTISRLKNQLTVLAERKTALHQELQKESRMDELQKELENSLKARLILQGELSSARHAMETLSQELHGFELRRQEYEREIVRFRDMLEALRIEWQGVKVKADTLIEQINETGLHLEEILQELPETASAEDYHDRLEQITQRISRLGPINLVAIDEYGTCIERKQYLDKQYNDLQEGLLTLESAIEKIDKETRTRFKQTFDKVNTRFQELFPIVFGGGQAYLELTGENLLDAGITVMACPPGKRNSSIHLLSGGEKAMTAIALVFSIFHLNPAPFCLLDEVDAPLDDANIGRFCQLVQTMAEKTQFIFISHNKIAIEMAETLIGVTMNEPGDSRLVSVDVQQAMQLAGE